MLLTYASSLEDTQLTLTYLLLTKIAPLITSLSLAPRSVANCYFLWGTRDPSNRDGCLTCYSWVLYMLPFRGTLDNCTEVSFLIVFNFHGSIVFFSLRIFCKKPKIYRKSILFYKEINWWAFWKEVAMCWSFAFNTIFFQELLKKQALCLHNSHLPHQYAHQVPSNS